LKWAAGSGNVEVLRNILQVVSSKDKTTMALASGVVLITAIQNRDTEAAETLIETKEGIFYQDVEGATALYWAARGGHLSICQALLLAGASRNERTLAFKTPLDWAMEGGNDLTINFLLRGGKKFNRVDTLHLQSLHSAARIENLNRVKDLHKMGDSLEMRDDNGQTVLFHAVRGRRARPTCRPWTRRASRRST
jgi:ankyrin repeat protein